MEVVCDQLFNKVVYNRMLRDFDISGPEHLEYFSDHPEKKKERLFELYNIIEDVAEKKFRPNDRTHCMQKGYHIMQMLETGVYRKFDPEKGEPDSKSSAGSGGSIISTLLFAVGSWYAIEKGKEKLGEFLDSVAETSGENYAEMLMKALDEAGYKPNGEDEDEENEEV